MNKENRYARDWNTYSQTWDEGLGKEYRYLGDEWNDDGSAERKRDNFYFLAYADRWIRPEMTALEVGPGGGKWTVRLAPKVKRLIVLDVAEEMLKRTRERCESVGLQNVEFVLANGRDFQPIPDECIDFFFSYDVFVHITLEDTWPYTQEMARVLVPGGRGACHYAINSVSEAWPRIQYTNDWYRLKGNTLGQYYYFSQETLRRMYEHCGLLITEQHQEAWHCTCVFHKLALSLVPRLESLLQQLADQRADDEGNRATIVEDIEALAQHLREAIRPLLVRAKAADGLGQRVECATEIRRLWRGL